MIKIVVFDLDDTLYPEKDYVLSGFKAVSKEFSDQNLETNFFKLSSQLFSEGKRGNIFNLALNHLEIPYDNNYIQKLLQVYRRHKPTIHLFEDAHWAINFFRHKELAIITDGYYESQLAKVSALNIKNKFSKIIFTDYFGREFWKPHIFAYKKIMTTFDCEGPSCLYIGDKSDERFCICKKVLLENNSNKAE